MSFNTADCVTYITQAIDAIKPEIVNADWRNVWKEGVNDIKDFLTIDKERNKIEYTRQAQLAVRNKLYIDSIT